MPAKGSLSKIRSKISYKYFEDIFNDLLKQFNFQRSTFKGFYFYAIDGDKLTLPCSKNILKNGYRGSPRAKNTETYYPTQYLTHCYDVLNGTSKVIKYSTNNDEYHHALEMIPTLEKNSVCLYDRLFFSRKLMITHANHGSHFIARCRKNGLIEIKELIRSSKRTISYEYKKVKIRLIKIKNPSTGEAMVFATSLPKRSFLIKEIAEIYTHRWAVENSFRDSSETHKLEQWHSHTLNGVLQELYAHYWLMNFTRMQMNINTEFKSPTLTIREYCKANYKLIFGYITTHWKEFIDHSPIPLKVIKFLVLKSTERRVRMSRTYPRQVKYKRRSYKSARLIERREVS